MSDATKIQWTDATWNPVTGCTKVSAGCANCYAERDWPRHYGKQTVPVDPGVGSPPPGYEFEYRPRRFTDVRCHQERLDEPLRWKKPRRVFVNSMADLFHEAVPTSFIEEVFARMALSPRHQFQVLTKRPERMREFAGSDGYGVLRKRLHRINRIANACSEPPDNDIAWNAGWPLPNVWLGVSAEDQATADDRIPILLDTPAAVRFVSAEPLLGPINLRYIRDGDEPFTAFRPRGMREPCDTLGLDWVIVGGESGPKSRPCDVAWIRRIVEECRAAGVACFVKQLGANWQPDGMFDRGKHAAQRDRKGGNPDEWPEDLRVRQFPKEVTA